MDETEDLNRLIRELNADGPGSAAAAERPRPAAVDGEPAETEPVRLDRWLEELVRRAGSDLLLVAGAPPSFRIDGRVLPLSAPPLSGDEIEEAVVPALSR